MNNFFKKHYEKFLVVLGALFLLVIAFSFLWSVSFLSNLFGGIFDPNNNGEQEIEFDIEGAKSLNLNIGE